MWSLPARRNAPLFPVRRSTRFRFLIRRALPLRRWRLLWRAKIRGRLRAVIADTVSVKRILPNIITKMNLPVMGPDGQPMSYSLDHKEGGKRLREDQTLVEARVGEGDHLIVFPEIVAG